MSRKRLQLCRMIGAVLAAYLLVLQGVLGGMASGRQVGFAALDQAISLAFCDPQGSDGSSPSHDGTAKLPPCCIQGCSLSAALDSPPPSDALLFAYDRPSRIIAEKLDPGPYQARRDGSTGRPRGPPITSLTI